MAKTRMIEGIAAHPIGVDPLTDLQ
jgi:hypothetical protein